MDVAYKQILRRSLSGLKLAAVSKAMPNSKVSFWGAFLAGSVGMLSIDALARENCSLCVKDFH